MSAFTVGKGEVVGIAGPDGRGRTELAMSLFGRSLWPRASAARCGCTAGRSMSRPMAEKAIDAGLAYVTEDRKTWASC
jgi:putative multiple sugar transport system ATP-binding protein